MLKIDYLLQVYFLNKNSKNLAYITPLGDIQTQKTILKSKYNRYIINKEKLWQQLQEV